VEAVNKFGRPTRDETEHNRDAKIDLKNFGDETVKFDLKGVKSRKLLAYHVEIWGNDSIAAQKDWKDFDTNVGDKWWQRY
ncbi:MAG: hypothetical protein WC637_19425, partial [Victivallales bacterium]|jgi:hypothetical protein